MTSTTYQVLGLTCEHCARAVTSELEARDGVTQVTVALVPGGQSAVTVSSEAPLSAEAVETALDEAGDYRLATAADIEAGNEAGIEADVQAPAAAGRIRTLPLIER